MAKKIELENKNKQAIEQIELLKKEKETTFKKRSSQPALMKDTIKEERQEETDLGTMKSVLEKEYFLHRKQIKKAELKTMGMKEHIETLKAKIKDQEMLLKVSKLKLQDT